MKIKFVDIQNYRKLKSCQINLCSKETLFVGANNSGKTSAIDALIIFLDQRAKGNEEGKSTPDRRFNTTDFTLSNWPTLNGFSESWLSVTSANSEGEVLVDWQPYCPSVDIWIDVKTEEIHRVSHLVPTLKWNGGLLGVRLIYQPKDIEKLMSDFVVEASMARTAVEQSAKIDGIDKTLQLWPKNIREFLDKKLGSYFEVKAYILDPEKIDPVGSKPQALRAEQEPLKEYPFKELFKVDVIGAQRSFSDPYFSSGGKNEESLSSQLDLYYSRHLNPSEHPEAEDIDALQAIDDAKNTYDIRLNAAFTDALSEIKGLGYPGFNDPDILLSSNIDPVENLAHNAKVVFDVQSTGGPTVPSVLALPESYNGLGYKNLIHMVFKLIGFRDNWMRKGKAEKRRADNDSPKEPLHIVLIEEPEAHLHAQVQQVFIRKAFDVLRKDVPEEYGTQMIVSSHSSYIAHEVGFDRLRYFKRCSASNATTSPSAVVVSLSEIFGSASKRASDKDDTEKFVARYIKTTHCDLFFANGIILVEGAAERMLLPHFISHNFDGVQGLNRSYISILEVGGAHAQRLKPLIESLGLPTLVITDTDATNATTKKATRPERGKGYGSGSNTLKDWFEINTTNLDYVLDLPFSEKLKGSARAAYQYDITVKYDGKNEESVIPYTFEDALAVSNIDIMKNLTSPTGMMRKMKNACGESTLDECAQAMYDALDNNGKAKMALDLLFDVEPKDLAVPKYIEEGLDWLQVELYRVSQDFSIPSGERGTSDE